LIKDMAEKLAEGIEIANIPCLLMLLYQMTGEEKWLEAPYRPKFLRGIGDNDDGGLTEDLQLEIRAAALAAIIEWKNGKSLAIAEPSANTLVRMLGVAMAEEIPEEYADFTAAQLGQAPFLPQHKVDVPANFSVIIIGAGIGGVCAAVSLQKAGIPYTLFEKNADVGGTWFDNSYPGCGVDTPNNLYSYSFAAHDWSCYFAMQDELKTYLERVATDYEVRSNMRFETTVESTSYDEKNQCWEVSVTSGESKVEIHTAKFVISAVGVFNPPVYPDIPGLSGFTGECWHSARWPKGASIKGKRVAVIGNGASAMQLCPEIQNQVKSMAIFAKSKAWVAPHPQFRAKIPGPIRYLLSEVPLYRNWYRVRLGWTFNDRSFKTLVKDPAWSKPDVSVNRSNDGQRKFFTEYMLAELGSKAEDLAPLLVPDYPPYGKRMLLDNGWMKMLAENPKVELVPQRLTKVEGDRLYGSDGAVYEADVIVLATGFDVTQMLNTFEMRGRGGLSVRDAWQDDEPRAYLGTTVRNFPNLFTLYGPNLQPGHGGSMFLTLEMQVRYAVDLISQMAERGFGEFECREAVESEYNERLDEAMEMMVWSHPKVETYAKNANGRCVAFIPYRNVDFYDRTKAAQLEDFDVRLNTVDAPLK
jgi:4-hydroxyacetophenone monooxygenase